MLECYEEEYDWDEDAEDTEEDDSLDYSWIFMSSIICYSCTLDTFEVGWLWKL